MPFANRDFEHITIFYIYIQFIYVIVSLNIDIYFQYYSQRIMPILIIIIRLGSEFLNIIMKKYYISLEIGVLLIN